MMRHRFTHLAKGLRRASTDAERLFWSRVRRHGVAHFKWKRQQPIGDYIVDFVCFESRVIVELDGGQHADAIAYDHARDEWLRAQGFRVLRFWNSDVMTNLEGVLEVVYRAMTDPSPALRATSPTGGEV